MPAHASRNSVHTMDHTADAGGSVFDSVERGASEIQLSAAGALPATSRFIGRVVYNTSYAVAFGVTFPVMMIVRVVPRDNALVHGLVDGALAARDSVQEWGLEVEDDHHDVEDEAHAAGNGTAHHEDSDDHKPHRRPRAKRTGARKTTRSSSRKKS